MNVVTRAATVVTIDDASRQLPLPAPSPGETAGEDGDHAKAGSLNFHQLCLCCSIYKAWCITAINTAIVIGFFYF